MRKLLWGRGASWLTGTVLLAGLLGLYLAAVAWAPHHLVDQRLLRDPRTTPGDRLSAEQGARLLVSSIAGALVVLGGLVFTGVNYRLSRRGQITDRFTKALERLSSPELYGRIGGIYALERVMHDSPGHLNDVVEVLAAFTRHHAPAVPGESAGTRRRGWRRRQRQANPGAGELPATPALDVQAALAALGHRPRRAASSSVAADLSDLHLRGARLDEMDLHGIIFDGADLRDCQLDNADLRGAQLNFADLRRANFYAADARGASLTGADLRGAGLVGTDLRGARLGSADLRGARLSTKTPRFLTAYARADQGDLAARLIWGRSWGYTTTAAKLRGALLSNVDLHGALLAGVDLRRMNLKRVNLEGTQVEFNESDVRREAFETLELARRVLGIDHDQPATASARHSKQHLFRRF